MSTTTCRRCGRGGDVAVHVEGHDPLIYCDPCRAADKPQERFTITAELRLTREPTRTDEERLRFVEVHHPGGAGVLWEVRLDTDDGPLVAKVNEGLVTGKLKVYGPSDEHDVLFEVREDREKVTDWLSENAVKLLAGGKT